MHEREALETGSSFRARTPRPSQDGPEVEWPLASVRDSVSGLDAVLVVPAEEGLSSAPSLKVREERIFSVTLWSPACVLRP